MLFPVIIDINYFMTQKLMRWIWVWGLRVNKMTQFRCHIHFENSF